MAVDPSVVINIAAEYTGKAAFKQADTATQKLSKGVGKLAKNLGLAFGTTAILAYGKASIKAAAADEKAQQQLALALKNVGLGRDAASSEAYIQDLQSEFGIVDDKLRPAYQTLAVATRSSAKAQQLLNLALDISASTGKDLGSVTAALSKAFLGNNTSLSKLGVGISKADLKAGKFEDIIAKLTTTFAGSATAAANTFQGSIDKLGVASANVQEIIGTGLIDALKNLGDSNSVDDLATSMQNTALYTADVIRGLGTLLTQLKSLPGVSKIDIGMIPIVGSYLEFFKNKGETSRLGGGGGFPQGAPKEFQTGIDARAAAAALAADAKARKAAALAAAKLAASQKATVKSQADALKLAKAKAVFDLQKIQIEAALKGKISLEEEIRLKLMKAIEAENLSQIEKYEKALIKAQENTAELQKAVNAIGTTVLPNPYAAYETYAADAIKLTNSVADASIKAGLAAGVSLAQALSGARLAAQGQAADAAAALAAAQTSSKALTDAQKTAQDAIAATAKAQQDALTAQLKMQQDALTQQNAAILAALNKRLADEAAAKAAARAAEAATLPIDGATAGAAESTDSTVDNTAAILAAATAAAALAKIAEETAAAVATATAAAAAQAAADAADAAGAGNATVTITVNAGVIANPDEVAAVVQEAIQTLTRNGDPLFTAGIE